MESERDRETVNKGLRAWSAAIAITNLRSCQRILSRSSRRPARRQRPGKRRRRNSSCQSICCCLLACCKCSCELHVLRKIRWCIRRDHKRLVIVTVDGCLEVAEVKDSRRRTTCLISLNRLGCHARFLYLKGRRPRYRRPPTWRCLH